MMTIDRETYPFLFSESHAENLSDRYTQVNTLEHLKILMQTGWKIHSIKAPKTTKSSVVAEEHKRHIVKLVPEDINGGMSKTLLAVGDSVPMIWLENSHDGKRALRLTAGIMRLICTNGMVVCNAQIQAVSIRHSQINLNDLRDVFNSYGQTINMIAPTIKDMQRISLTESQRIELAMTAMKIRFTEEQQELFRPEQLLQARRYDDIGDSLWNTFNIIQENCIKGGLTGYNANARRRVRSKAISAAAADLSINKKLWEAAIQYL